MARFVPAVRRALPVLLLLLAACSKDPRALADKHSRQGDEYMAKKQYAEAIIEYKNAVKAQPKDGALRWKLAKSLLDSKDLNGGYKELQRVAELDPANLEAKGKLGEIYLAAGRVTEAAEIADNLVKSRPNDPEGYLLQAGLAAREKRPEAAIELLKQAASVDPTNTRPLIALGNFYLLKREPDTARGWYQKAVEAKPGEVEPHLALGRFHFAIGDPVEGEKAYRQAASVADEKEKERVRLSLAEAFFFTDRLPEAEKELSSLIQEMKSQKARKVLGELKIEQGKVDEARPIVDDILRENDKDLEGKYLKGRIALADRKLDDAKTLFSEVARQDATMAKAIMFSGVVDVLQGRVESGRKEVETAVKADPANVRGHLILGDIYLKSGYPEGTEKEALEVLKRNRSSLAAAILLGDSFLARKEYRKGEQIFQSIIKQMPKNGIGYLKMGISRKLQGKARDAADYFAQSLAVNPKDLMVVNEYIFALLAAKDHATAEKVLADAVSKDPKNPLVKDMEGRYYVINKKYDLAEASFLKAIELAPNYTAPYYRLGLLYTSQKKLPEAEKKFRSVVDKDGKNEAARTMLAVVINSQGRIEDANKEYRKVLELSPKNVLAANNLAANLTDGKGNLDEALKFAQIAQEGAPDDPHVSDTLGWIYYRKGIMDTAHSLISEAAKKDGQNAGIRYHLGMVLANKGKKREAASELKAALSIDPSFRGNEEARTTLDSLK